MHKILSSAILWRGYYLYNVILYMQTLHIYTLNSLFFSDSTINWRGVSANMAINQSSFTTQTIWMWHVCNIVWCAIVAVIDWRWFWMWWWQFTQYVSALAWHVPGLACVNPSWSQTTWTSTSRNDPAWQTAPQTLFKHTSTLPSRAVGPPTSLVSPSSQSAIAGSSI